MGTELDLLSIGNFILHKEKQVKESLQEYKNKNRPSECKSCEEYPIYSNDSLKTWMCGNCKYNPFKPKKKNEFYF